jgi:hypothetical protein
VVRAVARETLIDTPAAAVARELAAMRRETRRATR